MMKLCLQSSFVVGVVMRAKAFLINEFPVELFNYKTKENKFFSVFMHFFIEMNETHIGRP